MGPPAQVLSHLKTLVAPGGRLVIIDVVLGDGWDSTTLGWQVPYAFDTARMVYFVSQRAEAAADTLRLMLHPRWLEMTRTNVPLQRAAFRKHYSAALPDVELVEDLLPTLCAAIWRAPEAGLADPPVA
jgi:hypothetical protein